MEVIRKAPGEIFIKSNTSGTARLLVFVSVILVILVAGICGYVIWGSTATTGIYLDSTESFYYSITDKNTARLELFVKDNVIQYEIPDTITHTSGTEYKITAIGANAFTNKNNLRKIIIPDSVQEIHGSAAAQSGAFSGCANLHTIIWGDDVRRIGAYAFKNCVNLGLKDNEVVPVTIPESVRDIGEYAFMNDINIKTLNLESNGQFHKTCFQNCVNVTKLCLGDEVFLDANKGEALARLINLTDFEVKPSNLLYVVTDDQHCVLSNQLKTLVLGGRGATIPTEVNRIADWAFDTRYENPEIDLLQYNIEFIGENAFAEGIIYTHLLEKQSEWLTKLPVRYGAKKVTFHKNLPEDETRDCFVYHSSVLDPELKMPEYEELFGKPEAKFLGWRESDIDGDNQCYAKYENSAKPTLTQIETLESLKNKAQPYIGELSENCEKVRLQFDLDFWEGFKTAYVKATTVYGKCNKTSPEDSSVLEYEVENIIKELKEYVDEIDAANPSDLENVDWYDLMQDLIDTVKYMLKTDPATGKHVYENDFESNEVKWWETENAVTRAETDLSEVSKTDPISSKIILTWRMLRQCYEAFRVNFEADAPLVKLIKSCETEKSSDYKPDIWLDFQEKLQAARAITGYNMSVINIREGLATAKANLEAYKINLASDAAKLKLITWASVCEGLQPENYSVREYDAILKALQNAKTLSPVSTAEEIESAVTKLQSAYNGLHHLPESAPEDENKSSPINVVPYFILAAILFSGAIATYSVAYSLRRAQASKSKKDE